MGVYIKNWSLADWKELLMWAKIGANNAMIGEFTEVEEVNPLRMDDYITEVIRRCAEANGPCWECAARGECLMWEESE